MIDLVTPLQAQARSLLRAPLLALVVYARGMGRVPGLEAPAQVTYHAWPSCCVTPFTRGLACLAMITGGISCCLMTLLCLPLPPPLPSCTCHCLGQSAVCGVGAWRLPPLTLPLCSCLSGWGHRGAGLGLPGTAVSSCHRAVQKSGRPCHACPKQKQNKSML